ncbi:MAG TPA: hypothetical protein VMT46_13225 [Anaerolineaceae bacterium]|nr:hypothetical protein [Anaerolineaceae bacterium]
MIYLATNEGLVVGEKDGEAGWRVVRRGLEGKRVTSVIAREGAILAGTRDGIFRSDDGGLTWREATVGLTHRLVRWIAFRPDVSDFEFAGTEPAGIFLSEDGANSWREIPEVARLRDEHHWFLPYSPEAGCVRGFAFYGSRAYAAVEVGGVLRSDDGGYHWDLAAGSDGNPDLKGPPEPFIYPDLHSIEVHPSSADLVLAPTGGGFYRSTDGGATWKLLYDCYVRAVWLDPAVPKHFLLGPADHVERNGRIEESVDGGATWQPASGGLNVPWPHHMVERFTRIGDDLLAVLSNGQLLAAPVGRWEWRAIFPDVAGINAVTEEVNV